MSYTCTPCQSDIDNVSDNESRFITCCQSDIDNLSETDIKDNFKINGYIKIWKNIYNSIAKKNINLTFEYIFKCNQSRFELENKYILPTPPNDYEKFLYLNSGTYSYLIMIFLSSSAISLSFSPSLSFSLSLSLPLSLSM
jgi:hypothetical protein